jgi:hypothetical protein
MANVFEEPAGLVDAYATVLSLDAASLPSPAVSPVRLAILDLDGNHVFDDADVQVFLQHIVPAGAGSDPALADFSRWDLNGDGFTGGSTHVTRFDLDRVGSTQFGETKYSTVQESIEGQQVSFDETALTDLQILCYYAYSPLYTGTSDGRLQLLGDKCGAHVSVTVTPTGIQLAPGAQQQFGASVTGASDQRVSWSVVPSGSGTITSTGLLSVASSATGSLVVRARSLADASAFGDASVDIVANTGRFSGTITTTVVAAPRFTQSFVLNVVVQRTDAGTFSVLQSSGTFNGTSNSTVDGCAVVDTTTASLNSATFIGSALRGLWTGTNTETNQSSGQDPVTGQTLCGGTSTNTSGVSRDFPYTVIRGQSGDIVALDFALTLHEVLESQPGQPTVFRDTTSTGRLVPAP